MKLARALRERLKEVLPYIRPFHSDEDIAFGNRWPNEIEMQLRDSRYAIVCVTHDNQHSQWLNYEAGALASIIDRAVCPFLLDAIDSNSITGPLQQFQMATSERLSVARMCHEINRKASDAHRLDSTLVEKLFERAWPALEADIIVARDESNVTQSHRSERDLLDELLTTVRRIDRNLPVGSHALRSIGRALQMRPGDAILHPHHDSYRAITEEQWEGTVEETKNGIIRIRRSDGRRFFIPEELSDQIEILDDNGNVIG